MRLCRITCAVLFGFVAITGALGGSEQFSKIRRLVASESETSLLVTSSKPLFQWQLTNDPSPRNISVVPRKPKRRGRKKNRNNLASSTMMVPPEANSTVPLVKPKKRKGKKRKNRKNKKKNPGINILEVTTARNFNLSKILTTNSTLSDLIQQLNKNPHENLVENTFKQTIIEVPQSSNTSKLINLHISMESSTTRRTKRRNRCSKNNGGCAHNCHLKGPRKCSCLDGFALAKDKRNCLDIDECVVNNAGCEQICKNTLGSYSCACKPGLRLSHNQKSCEDLNECLLRNGHGPCQDACQNTFGSYTCTCSNLNGTTLSEDGHNCVDNDECTLGKSECSHKCINAFGRSFCACPEGMELSSDWKTCQDVNECEDEVIAGKCQGCVNTDGSYICLENSGYQNEQPLGSLKQIACKALFPPRHGFISCSRKGALTSYTKSGRKRTKNSPGTTCKLNCPVGYRMRGQFHLTCGFSGVWQGKSNAKCIRGKPPFLKCPNDVVVNGTDFTTVNFAEPESNINWKYVKGHPAWTKGLSGNFSIGSHIVRFSVKDPTTKLMAFCSFKIVVVPNT